MRAPDQLRLGSTHRWYSLGMSLAPRTAGVDRPVAPRRILCHLCTAPSYSLNRGFGTRMQRGHVDGPASSQGSSYPFLGFPDNFLPRHFT